MFTRQARAGRWIARTALAGLATGALALAGSGSAMAYDRTPKAAPDAAANGLPAGGAVIGTSGPSANLDYTMGGQTGLAPVVRITLTYSDGEVRTAYCIDFQHEANSAGSEYDPGAWNESNVKNLPMIQWILTNSYPNKDAGAVLQAAGANVSGMSTSEEEFVAYAGTQTAIWHYSDGVDITGNGSRNGMSEADYAATQKVREYLIEQGKDAPEPASPTLTITPSSATGYAGDNVGPFTVQTTGTVDKLTLNAGDGSQVVDNDGNALTSVSNGTKFWIKTDSTAQVTVTGTGTGQIPTGEVYLAKAGADQYQKLILADTATKELSASATAAVSASPSPSTSGTAGGGGSLPVTGTSLPIIIGAAAALLAAGGVIMILARRRRA